MTIQDFETELKTINKDLSIRPNQVPPRVLEMFPDADKIATILFCGSEVCTIPNYEIFDEKNGNYGVDLRSDGRFVAHRTRPDALGIVKEKLDKLATDKDYADAFFGRGDYSNAALLKKDDPVPEVVDSVVADIKPVTDGMLEAHDL